MEDIVLIWEPLWDIGPPVGYQWVADIVHIVRNIDLAKGEEIDYPLEDIDLGNPEHQAQDNSLDNHKQSGAADNPAEGRRVNIVDKHLLEVVNMLVDQQEDKDGDEESRFEVRGCGFQVDRWNLACWSLESYPVSFSVAHREIWKKCLQVQNMLAVKNKLFIIKNAMRICRE